MTAVTNSAPAVSSDTNASPVTETSAPQSWPGIAVTIKPISPAPTTVEPTPSIVPAPAITSANAPNAPTNSAVAPTEPGVQPSQAWYVVLRGTGPGIYSSWLQAAPYVTGISGCIFSKYTSEALARAAWAEAQIAGTLVQVVA